MRSIFFIALVFFSFSRANAQICNEANSIISVTKRKTGRTEYVIFTVKNPTTASSAMSTVSPPFTEDPSGNSVTIKGCRYKRIAFNNMYWTCTINQGLSASTYLIQQVKKIGQFEGLIEFIIGYRCNTKSIVSYSYQDGSNTKWVVRLRY